MNVKIGCKKLVIKVTCLKTELIETFWPNRNQPTTEKPIVKMIKNKLVVTCKTEGANIGYKYLKRDLKPWIGWRPYTKPLFKRY